MRPARCRRRRQRNAGDCIAYHRRRRRRAAVAGLRRRVQWRSVRSDCNSSFRQTNSHSTYFCTFGENMSTRLAFKLFIRISWEKHSGGSIPFCPMTSVYLKKPPSILSSHLIHTARTVNIFYACCHDSMRRLSKLLAWLAQNLT